MPDILQKTHDLLDHQLKINRVELEIQSDNDLPMIKGDKDGLQQVLLNLINNAIDALQDKPEGNRKIRVSASVRDDTLHLEIADNGCGIPENIQQSIFEPFFTTKGEG